MSLVFHPHSIKQLDDFALSPSHGLIVSSENGVGTLAAAHYLVQKLAIRPEEVLLISPDKNTIPISEIRTLYSLTRSSRDKKLIVIIDDADAMGGDAQNALLKLLEEPPHEVLFILTTHRFSHLLPTIISRSRHIALRSISAQSSELFVSTLVSNDLPKTARILFLASGRPAEIYRLASNKDYYDRKIALTGDAKKILESESYTRLILLKPFMSDRESAILLLEMIGILLMHGLYKHIVASSIEAADAVAYITESLHKNGNVRAQLLLLNLRLS